MHAHIVPFVTRLRRDYNSVDGRSWRLDLREREKETIERLVGRQITEREECNPDTIATNLNAGFFFELHDSHFRRVFNIADIILFVSLEKLIGFYIS